MVSSLEKIQNPFLRSLTAASTVLSVITISSAIAIGLAASKNSTAHKVATQASLLGFAGGAIFGLTRRNRRLESELSTDTITETIWKDWRNFTVIRKVEESEEITSFYLEPEDKGEIPSFRPGQFLTIKLSIPGQQRPVIRTYSLSDYPVPCSYYRLSIKRELTPEGLEVPPGIASNFMHDFVHEGAVVQAKPPTGNFTLDVQKDIPAVLLSNGVGITPMISMLKAISQLNSNRPVWFIHGARNSRFHAFRQEVHAIAQRHNNINIYYVYSRPHEEDTGNYHSTGHMDISLIQSLINQEAEYFLCGSPAFMDSLLTGLREIGIPKNRIFSEMFTKPAKSTTAALTASLESNSIETAEIIFSQSQKTVNWNSDASNLLEFAEDEGLAPAYSCRQGICGTCQCKLIEGEVSYEGTPAASIDEGNVLICISKPKTSRLVLDL
jgi:hypothetical protein